MKATDVIMDRPRYLPRHSTANITSIQMCRCLYVRDYHPARFTRTGEQVFSRFIHSFAYKITYNISCMMLRFNAAEEGLSILKALYLMTGLA
jgi:hypothetical protein